MSLNGGFRSYLVAGADLRSSLRLGATTGLLCMNLALSSAAEADEPPPAQPDAGMTTAALVDSYATKAQQLIDEGMEYLGIRYRRGGDSPETGLDCSGLVQNVFRNALGLDLPRTARDMARLGEKVGYQELKPGDLVFFNTMRRAFSHVGIYVGEGRFLHAPASGGKVRVEQIDKQYWSQRFDGARRLVQNADGTALPPN